MKLLFLTLIFLCSCSTTQPQNGFEGTFVIESYLPTRGFSAITYEEASEFEGTEIIYSEELAQFGDEFCKSPTYSISTIDESTFFQQTRLMFNDLGLGSEMVYEVYITCGSKSDNWLYGTNLFFSSSDRVIFVIEGVWMEAVRK